MQGQAMGRNTKRSTKRNTKRNITVTIDPEVTADIGTKDRLMTWTPGTRSHRTDTGRKRRSEIAGREVAVMVVSPGVGIMVVTVIDEDTVLAVAADKWERWCSCP